MKYVGNAINGVCSTYVSNLCDQAVLLSSVICGKSMLEVIKYGMILSSDVLTIPFLFCYHFISRCGHRSDHRATWSDLMTFLPIFLASWP